MRILLLAGLAAAALAAPAWADEAPAKVLRLLGEAPSAKDPVPQRFVIDGRLTAGDSDFESRLEGWYAQLGGENPTHGEIQGSCVEKRCTLSVDIDYVRVTFIGDIGEVPTGPVTARFSLKDEDGKVSQQGPVTFRPLAGAAGLEPLAPPDAVHADELDRLLMWNDATSAGHGDADEPPSSYQRDSLANWQQASGKPPSGLIFAADLAALRAGEKAARAKVGWTPLSGKGWSAGYPASLLPKGGAGTFTSADGSAKLVLGPAPAMSGEAWDRFIDDITADRDGIEDRSYTRVNSDLEIRWKEKGVVTVAAYHNRDGGLVRVILTYPAAQEDAWRPYEEIIQRGLVVAD